MSQSPSRPVNRIPQIVILIAAAALIVFMILLGTDTIDPDGPTTLVIASVLAGVAFVGTMLEIAFNHTSNRANSATSDE